MKAPIVTSQKSNRVADSLELIPRSVRDKLDRVGIKLHLNEWRAFDLSARELLCALPCETADQATRYAATVERFVLQVTGKPAERLREEG